VARNKLAATSQAGRAGPQSDQCKGFFFFLFLPLAPPWIATRDEFYLPVPVGAVMRRWASVERPSDIVECGVRAEALFARLISLELWTDWIFLCKLQVLTAAAAPCSAT